RRKPELVDAETYSLVNFDEFERVADDYTALAERADAIRKSLPPAYDDAYVQLVWYPVTASANLNALYYTVARNRLHAEQGRADTNALAEEAEILFARDDALRRVYEEEIAGGKWVSMMSQTHIGYTYWQQPDEQVMPEVKRIKVPEAAGLGVAVAGRRENVALAGAPVELPEASVFSGEAPNIEIFNTGATPYQATIETGVDWARPANRTVTVGASSEVAFDIDWGRVPEGRTIVPVTVDAGALGSTVVNLPVSKPEGAASASGFVAVNGHVSAEAADATRRVSSGDIKWATLPNLGRSGDSLTSLPVTAPASEPSGASPRLEFDLHLFEAGDVDVTVTLAPTQDFLGQGGLRYAVSIDDGAPVIVNLHEGDTGGEGSADWERAVANYAYEMTTVLNVAEPGAHTLKLWRVDPGVVFQRVLVATGDVPESYLGPPLTPVCMASDEPLPDCSSP
ncbi:MAG: hypothetical protein RLN72_13930, partial [Henriciella sp.]